MPTFSVFAMGCKVSQFEAAQTEGALRALGLGEAEPQSADVLVLHACAVTARAERDAWRTLRRLRRENPRGRVFVIGCLARRAAEKIFKENLADGVWGELPEAPDLALFGLGPGGQSATADSPLPAEGRSAPSGAAQDSAEGHIIMMGRAARAESASAAEAGAEVSAGGHIIMMEGAAGAEEPAEGRQRADPFPRSQDSAEGHAIMMERSARAESLLAPACPAPDRAGPLVISSFPRQNRSRAFLKIQDGCSMSCAFCVIPSVRGRSRSADLETVLRGVRAYREMGFSEMVLTGIHLGAWGADLSPKLTIMGLLGEIDRVFSPDPESFRVRLSSVEPNEAALLMEAFGSFPWLAPHLHIPLQSGSARVLAAMRRPYQPGLYRDLVLGFRERHPLMGLGADVMAGFPAEGAAEFGESLAFVERLPLSRLHVFPYSPRGGTRAASLTDGPPPQEAARRAGRLRELDKAMRRAFAGRNRGEGALVLAESRRRGEGGRLRGVTGNYLKVAFPEGARVREGSLVRAVIGAADPELGIPEALP